LARRQQMMSPVQAQYNLGLVALLLAFLLVVLGAVMVFIVPPTSVFDMAVQAPHTSAKLTNGTAGMGFVVLGVVLAIAVVRRNFR